MEENHTLRNALSSDLDLPKSKIFLSALTMKFLISRVVTLITIALAKVGSPANLHVNFFFNMAFVIR